MNAIRDTLTAHFVMWHDRTDSTPSEWRCSCGAKFGFSATAIEHQAREVREAVSDALLTLRDRGTRPAPWVLGVEDAARAVRWGRS